MSLETKIRELMEAKKAKAHELNEAVAGKSNDGESMNANKQQLYYENQNDVGDHC
jgi:hypothetical protein